MPLALDVAAATLRQAIKTSSTHLVDREPLVDLVLLAAIAGEHLLVIGPPGTAKSAAVRKVAKTFDCRYFEYLLGRFTEPSELFGPIDLRKLRDGLVETATEGMLPEAEIAFLDEVFLGSTAVLNTLLGILNERQFRRGHTLVHCPLKICVAAANHLPEDEALAAFADRFLVHSFVDSIADAQLEILLEQGWRNEQAEIPTRLPLESLTTLSAYVQRADLSAVRPVLAECIRLLRKNNIHLSDRRLVKSQKLIAAAGVMDGRASPTDADLWPLLYVINSREDQITARELLKDLFGSASSTTLTAAAEEASYSPKLRAQRLINTATTLFAQPLDEHNRIALACVGREIDTGFSQNAMPEDLKILRDQLVQVLDLADFL